VFHNFRIATMALPGTHLSDLRTGEHTYLFEQPDNPFGQIDECAIGVTDGIISWILPTSRLPVLPSDIEMIDGQNGWLTPGLIDCHTHLIYGGNRASEWEMRINGVSYEDIARHGGGILSSVRSTREASHETLTQSATKRLNRLMEEGVTTFEIKSGYGLDLESELKMLAVANALAENHPITIEPTLLAAHAVPPEFKNKSDAYIDIVCQEIIPAAKDQCAAVDVFCESIAFSIEQSIRVFQTAIDHDLKFKVHAEQLSSSGIAAIAAEMGALSADHLEFLTAEDCQKIGKTSMVATLLPGAFYCLRETQFPPVNILRENKVPIAIATDCNPGSSPVTSLLLMGNMACNLFRLTAEESLQGMTIHAAKALGIQHQVGSLEPGKFADFAIWDVDTPAEIVYGVGHNPCVKVFRHGVQIQHRSH
ncbi:MAG: imidazolonepropionase, partial [Planctomycetota bacterium]